MAIKEPRKFVTTDQGHADVLNIPITTLYENDQALAAQLESIKTDPAGNDIASKAALDSHAANTDLHVTAAKQAAWNAAEGNAKKYTEQYAAPKAHTHAASDLPSATTQARGVTKHNTSVSSTATDESATPSAVKTAYDRANEAYNRADQAFTQAVDFKNKIVGAISGKGGSANSGMTGDQLATAIINLPVKRWAEGDFRSYDNHAAPNGGDLAALPAIATVTVNIPAPFSIGSLYIYIYARIRNTSTSGGGYVTNDIGKGVLKAGTNGRGLLDYGGYVNGSLSGNTLTLTFGSTINADWRKDYYYELGFWSAYE